jgi:hypothetical protein
MKASDILIVDGNTKFDAEVIRKPGGAIIIDGNHIADTMKCTHCGHVWIPIVGSGRIRGWCTKCNGPTCGSKECHECYPFEKKLNDYEKGLIKILK